MSRVVALRGLGALGANAPLNLDGTCPPGTNRSCALTAPGVTPTNCWCAAPPSTTTQATRALRQNWGLIAAVLIGGFIVFKVTTR